jgi:hypothetical protein
MLLAAMGIGVIGSFVLGLFVGLDKGGNLN